MEPWKWQQLLGTVAFLGITYIPLQCVAIWKCRGIARVAAALPLLVMVPMIIGACRPTAYENGSLFGMFFVCPYLPVMIYLIAVSLAGTRLPKVCPHCGHKRRIKSFQMTNSSTNCENCGRDLLENAPVKSDSAPDSGSV